MGQYYLIANMDKRQQMYPFDYGNGLRLMEWSYNQNPMVMALLNLLADKWKGDRVYVVGDYADRSDPKEPYHDALKKALDEIDSIDLHEYAWREFRRVLPEEDSKVTFPFDDARCAPHADFRACTQDCGYRYIYNHATRQVVDLNHCPIEWVWYDKDARKANMTKVAPLPLLIAMGNGRGGGDYHRGHPGYELVGSWCGTSASIEVTKEPLEVARDYEEFTPGFTEQNPPIPWTEEKSAGDKLEEEYRKEEEWILSKIQRLVKIAGDLGWTVFIDGESSTRTVDFERHTSGGEDFVFSVYGESANELAKEVRNYSDSFDTEEHITDLLVAKRGGLRGVPDFRTLADDADAIEEMLIELADALEAGLSEEGEC